MLIHSDNLNDTIKNVCFNKKIFKNDLIMSFKNTIDYKIYFLFGFYFL